MPQNQEQIEARLAAYIDGELDANERAEIEKHLENNPQHKQLIEELQGEIPGIRESMMAALGHVVPSHLLDASLFNFRALSAQTGDVQAELDAALGDPVDSTVMA